MLEMLIDGYAPQLYTESIAFPDKLAVILHKARGESGVIEPDVIKMDDNGGVVSRLGHSIPWNSWFPHCLEINKDNPGANTRLLRWEADLFNNDQDPEVRDIDTTKPVSAISQDFGGNLVAWDIETATKIRLLSYHYLYDVSKLDPKKNNFYKQPWMYRLCTVVNSVGSVFLPAGGVVQFMPRVAYTELWIEKSKVRFLYARPSKWDKSDVLKPNPVQI